MESSLNQERPDKQRSGLWGLFGLVAAFSLAMSLGQFIVTKRAAPATSVRIAATLVSWGLTTDGLSVGVRAEEIDRNVALLRSPDGEERVRAAADVGWGRPSGNVGCARAGETSRRAGYPRATGCAAPSTDQRQRAHRGGGRTAMAALRLIDTMGDAPTLASR